MKRGIFEKEKKGWGGKSLIYGVIMPPRTLFVLRIDMGEVNDEKPSGKINKSNLKNHYDKLKGKTFNLSKVCFKLLLVKLVNITSIT